MFIALMQNLLDQGARKGCTWVFGASEHPCRDFVHLPGPAVSIFQSSAHGQVAQQDTDSGFPSDGCCIEPLAEAAWGESCTVPSGGQYFLFHPELPGTAKLLSSPTAEGLTMEVPKGSCLL